MTKFNKIKKQAKKLFKGAEGSHDWEHTERVAKLAEHIGKKEKADMEIVKLAALLHDIGLTQGRTVGLRRKNHAKRGAKMARALLRQFELETERIEKIAHCIRCHRFREDGTPQTVEAKVLHDADKLDSIGADPTEKEAPSVSKRPTHGWAHRACGHVTRI